MTDLVSRRPGFTGPPDVRMHRSFATRADREAHLHQLRVLAVEWPLGQARLAQLLVGLDHAGMLGREGLVRRRKLLLHVESSSPGQVYNGRTRAQKADDGSRAA